MKCIAYISVALGLMFLGAFCFTATGKLDAMFELQGHKITFIIVSLVLGCYLCYWGWLINDKLKNS